MAARRPRNGASRRPGRLAWRHFPPPARAPPLNGRPPTAALPHGGGGGRGGRRRWRLGGAGRQRRHRLLGTRGVERGHQRVPAGGAGQPGPPRLRAAVRGGGERGGRGEGYRREAAAPAPRVAVPAGPGRASHRLATPSLPRRNKRRIMRIFTLPPAAETPPEPNFYDSMKKIRLRQQLEMYSIGESKERGGSPGPVGLEGTVPAGRASSRPALVRSPGPLGECEEGFRSSAGHGMEAWGDTERGSGRAVLF